MLRKQKVDGKEVEEDSDDISSCESLSKVN
jgi:hypothetical protein